MSLYISRVITCLLNELVRPSVVDTILDRNRN